jgi:hypothetical protein
MNKGQGSNCKSGNNSNNNNNKSKDNNNNDKSNNNVGVGKKEKRKVKFPCKICKDDHLTHLCPKIEEAFRLIVKQPIVMTNPFPHNQNMTSGTSNTKNASRGSQNPLAHDGGHLFFNMVKCEIILATQSRHYGSSQLVLGPEPPPPLETPLKIDNPEPQPCISKGVLKRSSHSINARTTQYYLII